MADTPTSPHNEEIDSIKDQILSSAQTLIKVAQTEEALITPFLRYLGEFYKGELVGLDYRLKFKDSLVRKMLSFYLRDRSRSIEDIAADQYDVLRYTMLLRVKRYVSGAKGVMDEMKAKGYKEVEIKNYWGSGTYQGINTIFKSPNGQLFELQFHTPESFEVKQSRTHEIYEMMRTETDPVKQHLLYFDCVLMQDAVNVPEGALEIGSQKPMVMLPLPTTLSEEQKMEIESLKAMKLEIRSLTRALYTSASESEPELTALLNYLAVRNKSELKHLDFRFKDRIDVFERIEHETRMWIAAIHKQQQQQQQQQHGGLKTSGIHDAIHDEMHDEPVNFGLVARYQRPLHYIVVPEFSQYTVMVNNIIHDLQHNGCEIMSVHNFWNDVEKYSGIKAICHFNEIYFDVEFHTVDSIHAKEMRKHLLEQKRRQLGHVHDPRITTLMLRYDKVLERQWQMVGMPVDALSIGIITKHNPDAIPSRDLLLISKHILAGKVASTGSSSASSSTATPSTSKSAVATSSASSTATPSAPSTATSAIVAPLPTVAASTTAPATSAASAVVAPLPHTPKSELTKWLPVVAAPALGVLAFVLSKKYLQ